MRKLLLSMLLTGLFLSLVSPAHADDVQAILDKAVKAVGGEEKLLKFKAGTSRVKGSLEIGGASVPFSSETYFQIPGQFKETAELEIMGVKVTASTILNGDKISNIVNGMSVDVPENALADLKESVQMMEIARLAVLRKRKDIPLSTLGEIQVNGRPALGVKVAPKGMRELNLFFDKETGLLVKLEKRVLDGATMQEVLEERFPSEYQEVDGIKTAKKVLVMRDGKKYMEAEVLESKMLEKLDENVFAVP